MNIENENLYLIGGAVRDEILNIKCLDVDITYIGNAIEFAKSQGFYIIKENEPFGTVKILLENKEIDLASTRAEIYPQKGHLPVVSNIGCSLKDDILRRDFTINTLAKSTKTGEIVDYLNGLEDIKNKKIRILHENSFIDDPTRIIRALKFSIRFGFELEKNTKKLQNEYLENINYDMSYKRIKKELIETFNLNSQLASIKFFEENIYKLLTTKNITPPNFDIENLINKYPVENPWIVYLGWIDLSCLPLTKKESKIIQDYKKLLSCDLSDDYLIYSAFKDCEKESILLYAISGDDKKVLKYLDNLSKIEITTTGKDLINLGITPSSKYNECFEYILKSKLLNKNVDEITLAKEFFNLI